MSSDYLEKTGGGMKIVSEKMLGASSLLGGAFVVSTFGIWARFVSPMFNTATQTVIRCFLAASLMAGILFISQRKSIQLRGYTRTQYVWVLLLGFLTFVQALLFTVSVTHTKVGNTFSLTYAGSILIAFFIGVFWLQEKTSSLKVCAVLIALAGLVMYGSGLLGLSIGILTGLGAGVCDGLSNVTRKQLRGVDRSTVITCQYIIAGVCTVPLVLLSSGDAIKIVNWGSIIALIMFTLASLTYAKLLLQGFSHFDVNIGGVILAMQIFFGMLLGFVFFHEVPSSHEITGSILIFTAVIITMVSGSKLFSFARKKQTEGA